MKIHDVTLVMRPGMPTWPGEDGPSIEPLRRIANGDGANVSVVRFGNHTGTHVDQPIHFIEGANTVDRLPLDALAGPCRVPEPSLTGAGTSPRMRWSGGLLATSAEAEAARWGGGLARRPA